MRKSNTKFHAKRQSGRQVIREILGRLHVVDCCKSAHEAINDKGIQLATNSLLTGILNRAGVFA